MFCVVRNCGRNSSFLKQSCLFRKSLFQTHLSTRPDSALTHNSNLRIDFSPSIDRKTKIICTMGPACWERETLRKMLLSGMNTVRLNFSHGHYDDKERVIKDVRELSESYRFTDIDFSDGSCEDVCGIAADTKGPEIRTGLYASKEPFVLIEKGSEVTLSTKKAHFGEGSSHLLFVDYENLAFEVGEGQKIFVDDGLLELEVVKILPKEDKLVCVAQSTCQLGTQKGVNIPFPFISSLPPLTRKDASDLKFIAENKLDFVFASFMRRGSNIREIRAALGKEGADVKVIAKIENEEGVENFDDILEEADGIMVARGDLGIEIPPQKVNIVQKMMIAKCNLIGKPVICATQMLESMVSAPRATRAECSDVINAVLDGADGVMLSGETAKGSYPVEALELMSQLCLEAEAAVNYETLFQDIKTGQESTKSPFSTESEAAAASAVTAAFGIKASAILVIGAPGLAKAVAKYRPSCPILFVTHDQTLANSMMLRRGVVPLVCEKDPTKSTDSAIQQTIQKAQGMEIISENQPVLALAVKRNRPHLIFA